MLKLSIFILRFTKISYFADTSERGHRGEREGKDRLTFRITLLYKIGPLFCPQISCSKHMMIPHIVQSLTMELGGAHWL
jgi:hypothetical protein